jgi:hypothetical protein
MFTWMTELSPLMAKSKVYFRRYKLSNPGIKGKMMSIAKRLIEQALNEKSFDDLVALKIGTKLVGVDGADYEITDISIEHIQFKPEIYITYKYKTSSGKTGIDKGISFENFKNNVTKP